MGNVALISLYQDTEKAKADLYNHFIKWNLKEEPSTQPRKVHESTNFLTETMEINPVKSTIIDFINQNLDNFSECHFTQLIKHQLNLFRAKNPKIEFKFLFFLHPCAYCI